MHHSFGLDWMGSRAARAGRAAPVMLALLALATAPIGLAALAGKANAAQRHRARAGDMLLPVPKVTIYPGDVVTGELLETRRFSARRIGRLPVFRAGNAIVGKVARRTLLPGRAILRNAVRGAFAVRQGKSARVIYRAGGLSISSYAIALQSGGPGDIIALRNVDSGRMFKGLVLADGTINVGTP